MRTTGLCPLLAYCDNTGELLAQRLRPGNAGANDTSDNIAILVEAYPGHKAGIESLYAIPEVKYGAPGLVFNAQPTFADWWG